MEYIACELQSRAISIIPKGRSLPFSASTEMWNCNAEMKQHREKHASIKSILFQDGMCLNEKQKETNKYNAKFKEIQRLHHDRIPTFAL